MSPDKNFVLLHLHVISLADLWRMARFLSCDGKKRSFFCCSDIESGSGQMSAYLYLWDQVWLNRLTLWGMWIYILCNSLPGKGWVQLAALAACASLILLIPVAQFLGHMVWFELYGQTVLRDYTIQALFTIYYLQWYSTHAGLAVVCVEVLCCCPVLVFLCLSRWVVLVTQVGEVGSWGPIAWFCLIQSVGSKYSLMSLMCRRFPYCVI